MSGIRTLVFCDDAWHPAEMVQHGFNTLARASFDFKFLAHGGEWTSAMMKDFGIVVVAKVNHRCAKDQTPWLTAETETAIAEFIRRGGGLLAIHGGVAGYESLSHMRQSLGGAFLNHPDQCLVTVKPKADHLLTSGISQFTVTDEHYMISLDDGKVDIFLNSCSEHGTQPAGWTRTEGEGRVCVLTPGHNIEVWLHPEFQKLLRNGLEWVAKMR